MRTGDNLICLVRGHRFIPTAAMPEPVQKGERKYFKFTCLECKHVTKVPSGCGRPVHLFVNRKYDSGEVK